VDKGSRQVSSVTLGKGVALGAGLVGPSRTRTEADAGFRAAVSMPRGVSIGVVARKGGLAGGP
jgi:hypothetical protein